VQSKEIKDALSLNEKHEIIDETLATNNENIIYAQTAI
jgi:hypothetical protein